jgi:outer membrane lipoprotein carrier protein
MLKKLMATLALGIGTAFAGPADDLQQRLSGYESARAEFSQFALSSNGDRAEESVGYFYVARPDRFRWVTEQPFVKEIVSDGESIWIHDPDLDQVTRRPSGSHGNSAPALILNGQISELQKQFSISRIDENEQGISLFELRPLNPEGNTFARIRLLFEQERLTELSMEDSLGQRSMLVLHDLEYNPELPQDIFEFSLPPGADLIEDPGF